MANNVNDSQMGNAQQNQDLEQALQGLQQLGVKKNPMQNHLVLEVLFRHLASSEEKDSLRNCRRVSKLWNYAAQNVWQENEETLALIDDELFEAEKSRNLSVEQDTILNGLCPPNHKGPCMSLDEFLKCSADRSNRLSKHPYSKYILVSWEFHRSDFPGENSLAALLTNKQKFWTLHGANVKVLKLIECKFPEVFLVFRRPFLACLPNLKEMHLENSELDRKAIYNNFGYAIYHIQAVRHNIPPEILNREVLVHNSLEVLKINNKVGCLGAVAEWRSVFLTCPNLKKLTLKTMETRGEAMFSIGMIFAQIRDSGHLVPNLEYLDVMDFNYLAVNDLGLSAPFLSQMNGKTLEHVGMDIGYKTKLEEIRESFEFQAATLKSLRLFRAPFCEPYSSFPCRQPMIFLEELHLWGNVCGSLEFLRLMPNLKVLKWNMSCFERRHDKLSKLLKERVKAVSLVTVDVVENTVDLVGTASPNVHTLELDCQVLSIESWRKLGRLMPNVKKLRCVVKDDKILVTICKQWRQSLEKLELMHGSCVTDNGILEMAQTSMEKLVAFTWQGCSCMPNDISFGLGPVSFGSLGFPMLPSLEKVETCTRMEVGSVEQDFMGKHGIHLEMRCLYSEADAELSGESPTISTVYGLTEGKEKCPKLLFQRAILHHDFSEWAV